MSNVKRKKATPPEPKSYTITLKRTKSPEAKPKSYTINLKRVKSQTRSYTIAGLAATPASDA